MKFSIPQQEAVEHFMGPCLCIAGPGSGKTLVLTERIGHLIREHGVAPQNILVVTFTRDAAMSMQQRFSEKFRVHPLPAFGTFHSIFFNILRREGRLDARDIISGRRSLAILSYAVNECGIKPANENFYPKLIRTISYYKNCGVLDENNFPADTTTEDIRQVIEAYQRTTREAGLYDFDDLLVEMKHYFEEHPDRLKYWRGRFPFILVDEAQDMNLLQYRIITSMAGESANLFLVGDDDQAIYGFRGSDPSFLLGFTGDYPDAHTVILNCNYRCDRRIVASSARLISENRTRFEKDLVPGSSEDGTLEIVTSDNDRDEAVKVCDMIEALISSGVPGQEIAVLYRNRRAANSLMSEMARIGRMKSDSDLFFYRSFVYDDILAILRCTEDKVRREDFLRALMHPDRNVGRMGLADEMIDKKKWLSYMQRTILAKEAQAFIRELDFLKQLSPYSAINYIMKRMGYEKFIRDYSYRNGVDSAMYSDHAERIREASAKYRRISEFCVAMTEKKEGALSSQEKRGTGEIGFYTFHGSKGLEFDHVFIIGVCDGITPSDKADTVGKLEEERRMFYVAMTRARKHLVISVCARYGNHAYYPSPFIKEALG